MKIIYREGILKSDLFGFWSAAILCYKVCWSLGCGSKNVLTVTPQYCCKPTCWELYHAQRWNKKHVPLLLD